MKKLFYLDKKEVKIGDKIDLSGTIVTITPQLIDDLPNLFKVEEDRVPEYMEVLNPLVWPCTVSQNNGGTIFHKNFYSNHFEQIMEKIWEKQSHNFKPSTKEAWLLQEAKRRYPKGTKFKSIANLNENFAIITSSGDFKRVGFRNDPIITDYGHGWNVYRDGQWAEIVKPLFVTEDGVEIFEGDDYWYVDKKYGYSYCIAKIGCQSSLTIARFSTREAAEEYVAKHREKTLEDYENEIDNITSISGYSVYRWLKDNDGKLYYSKVLQLIADNLNEGWEWEYDSFGYVISEDVVACKVCTPSFNDIVFKEKEECSKAIKIMGDKLDIIYKS